MPITRWFLYNPGVNTGAEMEPTDEGDYVFYEDHLTEVRKLEHIIEGLNAQLLAESEEIHDLEEEIHELKGEV